jgi:AcrR family transcriptional regulator
VGLREEKKERLKTELYETAIRLFRTRGFDQTRVQDIITSVGVSEPTFFNYFATKEAVLEEFAARAIDGFIDRLREQVDDEARPVSDKVRGLLESVAEVFSTDPEFMAVVATRSSLFWGAQGGVLERELGMYALATDLFRRAQHRGEIRPELDPERLAETFTGAYMLAVVNWLVGWWETKDDLADRLNEQATVLLGGCLAEASPERGDRRRRTRRRR